MKAATLDFPRSPSQRKVYRECPQKWLLQYGAGWKQKVDKAIFPYGTVLEKVATAIAVGQHQTPEAAVLAFRQLWAPYATKQLQYAKQGATSHKVLMDRGIILVPIVFREIHKVFAVPKPGEENPYIVQQKLVYQIKDTTWEQGYLDIAGPVNPDGKGWGYGIVDFKSGGQKQPEHLAERNEQLMSYQLGKQETEKRKIDWLGLMRMLYTTQPDVQWCWVPAHSQELLDNFIIGALQVDRQIKAGEFGANNHACHDMGGCWAQPLCFTSQAHRREAELMRDERKAGVGMDELEI